MVGLTPRRIGPAHAWATGARRPDAAEVRVDLLRREPVEPLHRDLQCGREVGGQARFPADAGRDAPPAVQRLRALVHIAFSSPTRTAWLLTISMLSP